MVFCHWIWEAVCADASENDRQRAMIENVCRVFMGEKFRFIKFVYEGKLN